VRCYENRASVEIARDELARALEPEMSASIEAQVRAAGFAQVAIDPKGYRQGSLNEALRDRRRGEDAHETGRMPG
jgi:uncharacterized protein